MAPYQMTPYQSKTLRRLGVPEGCPLSPRQLQALGLAARGRSNKEIARAMGVTEQTVKNHFTNTLERLNVARRHHAIIKATRLEWLGREWLEEEI